MREVLVPECRVPVPRRSAASPVVALPGWRRLAGLGWAAVPGDGDRGWFGVGLPGQAGGGSAVGVDVAGGVRSVWVGARLVGGGGAVVCGGLGPFGVGGALVVGLLGGGVVVEFTVRCLCLGVGAGVGRGVGAVLGSFGAFLRGFGEHQSRRLLGAALSGSDRDLDAVVRQRAGAAAGRHLVPLGILQRISRRGLDA